MNENDLTSLDQLAATGAADFDIRISRNGVWFYRGSPIKRKPLVKLFSTVLRRDDSGDFWLQTPVERGRITVEDAPFTAVEVNAHGAGRDQTVVFRTNLDALITVDADHPIHVTFDSKTGEPSPYVTVRDNLDALILRAVFYELVELGEERDDGDGVVLGVWSKGEFFPLGEI
jgi:hypothetical protein